MKKILTYTLVIMILVAEIFVLTGCSSNETNGGQETMTENQEVVEIVTNTDYTKWPKGVYDAYKIPEYTAGTHAFSMPADKNGTTFRKTTFSEFETYINGLLDKGYRMPEDHKDAIKEFNDSDKNKYNTIAVELYDAKPGKGYVVEFQYYAAEQSQEVREYQLENPEPFTYEFNLIMWVEEKNYPEESKDTELLTKYGISDEVVVPDFKTYTIEKYEDDEGRININIDAGYDYEFSQKEINEYRTRLANELLKISDDGKIYDMRGEKELTAEEDKLIGYYVFKYQGAEYRCYCEMRPGFEGGRMAVGIEPK